MNFGYAIVEAFRSMRRVPLMTTVSVSTIALSLMVFGLFMVVTYNVRGALLEVQAKVDVEAYLEEDIEGEALSLLRAEIATIPGVESVRYISKENARERFAAEYGDTLLALLSENPLPASLLVTLIESQRTGSGAETVAAGITSMEGVNEVVWGRSWADRLDRLILALTALSILIGLVVSLASVFVISNTVKLTVWARRDAIEIMKLVGATDGFVKLPFFIEGTIQGFAGAGFALLILFGIYGYVQPGLAGVVFLPTGVCGAMLAMGAALGGIGSQVSIKQFLEV
ncbi:cell division protein FtsX [Gemmatimonadota bacterium]